MATLACNVPGPPTALIGNATWTGVSLNTILGAANLKGTPKTVVFHALDGYVVNFGLQFLLDRDDIILAYGMNGATLPEEQGYPIRLVLPGSKGYQWVQWLERIEIHDQDPSPPYWWFHQYPLHAKMLVPQDGETILPGTQTISGFAFDGKGREIVSVDISTDGGINWGPAQLLNSFVPNAWKHWEFNWDPPVGTHQIFARVEDNLGNIQQETVQYGWRPLGITIDVDIDSDGDSIPDGVDNCPDIPNGPNLGSCLHLIRNVVVKTCTSQGDCGCVATCNLGQDDADIDDIGNVCDNCPDNCNYDQWDADGDTIGDVCDPEPGCGGGSQPVCEQECVPDTGPPADHTIDKQGFFHKEGLYEPEAHCTTCHGADLTGGFGPSCYSCHSDVWNTTP
jgi:hypothetical protein